MALASGGRKLVHTEPIVVQVRTSENEEKGGGFWEGFPFGDANVEAVYENGLRKGEGK
jgi:hypothetical protein